MNKTKSFTCPVCNSSIKLSNAWLLTHNSEIKCSNCNNVLKPKKNRTRLIAVLVSMNSTILVVLFGGLGFRYQGILYGITYGIVIGFLSFLALYFLNKHFTVFTKS